MQREISVSEFFTKNRHLLGFDNPRKALLTAVKEGVDNALDACEEAGILPDVRVAISAHRRIGRPLQGRHPGQRPRHRARPGPAHFRQAALRLKFQPDMKMSRGQQGIGISAAGMYGQLTTGKATRIISKTAARKKAYECELLLEPARTSRRSSARPNSTSGPPSRHARRDGHGGPLTTRGRQSVEEYLYQVSIANPHATIRFDPPEGDPFRIERTSKELRSNRARSSPIPRH